LCRGVVIARGKGTGRWKESHDFEETAGFWPRQIYLTSKANTIWMVVS